MTAANENIKPESRTSIRWYIGILIAIVVLFIFGLTVNICIMNKQFKKNDAVFSKSKQSKNPLTNLKFDSSKIYKLSEQDLQKFNDHIDFLADKVEGEVKRTQENSQYDIDRINTMLAIGIGLLAIIGGLLPIFVNFFSKEHLEKRMTIFETKATTIEGIASNAKQFAESAEGKAKTASDTVSGLDTKVTKANETIDLLQKEIPKLSEGLKDVKEATKKIPYIDLLVFQNAVAKLTSTDALKLFIGANRYSDIAAYLQNLISAIDSFDDDLFENNTEFDTKYFLNVITELKLAFRMGPIRRIPDGRSFQSKIDEAILQLAKFENMEIQNYKTQLKTVSGIISELKQLVINKSV